MRRGPPMPPRHQGSQPHMFFPRMRNPVIFRKGFPLSDPAIQLMDSVNFDCNISRKRRREISPLKEFQW